MSSKRSAELPRPPDFFVDRSLGKVTAEELRAEGWQVHLIADAYPNEAADVQDEEWIAEGTRRGWALLTKDRAIRYRAEELASLAGGQLFCLANAELTTDRMVAAFVAARGAIERAVHRGEPGFWHVHTDGRLKRMWP
jgi:uncharacterized protein with PIN domain